MTKDDINKTIAEYMGWGVRDYTNMGMEPLFEIEKEWFLDNMVQYCQPSYTYSLDALIPVVDKLGSYDIIIGLPINNLWGVNLECYDSNDVAFSEAEKTPSLALATALAKAITELKND